MKPSLKPTAFVDTRKRSRKPTLPPGVRFVPKPFTTDQLCGAIERERA